MYGAILNRKYLFKIIIFIFFFPSLSVLAREKDRTITYQVHINRGRTHADRGEHDKAIEDYNRAMELNQRDPMAYILRGSSYAAKGEQDNTIEDYNRAIALDPREPVAYLRRASSYRAKRQFEKEIEDYNRVLQMKPDRATVYQAYLSRGNFYANKGEQDRAIEDYNKAITLNPKNPTAYILRGCSYDMKHEYEKGIEDLKKAIALEDPHTYKTLSRVHYNYGNYLKKKGQYDMAVKEYSAAIVLTPSNPHLYTGRGYAYILKRDKQSAMVDLQKACDLGDKNGCHILEVLKTP